MLTVAITIGDPAGVGPEVVRKALADPTVSSLARWIVVGQPPRNVVMGRTSAECGRAALAAVRGATAMCLRGEVDAMVTAPLNKKAVALTEQGFTGHTDFIADLCGAEEPRMLLVNRKLCVLHVTTHCPLRQACDITTAQVTSTIQIGETALARLGVLRPRIAVCGLNPHAGESGLLGREDRNIIDPAIRSAQARGVDCHGPFPADTLFLKARAGEYDLVIAMYHDQGHIAMKLLDFEHTVNVSLGLPIIRTSVDHGTAFDIAGKDIANPSSMKAAMRLAVAMASNDKQ